VAKVALDNILLHGDSIRLRTVKGSSGRYRRKRMKMLFVQQELSLQMASFGITRRQWEGIQCRVCAFVSVSGTIVIRCLVRGV
jgi:hypothetical protein